jgi:DNA invertase Pin-like site-specific DNA recombinase
VKLVLVEALHRLARDQVVQELILRDLRKHGFDLIPVMEPDLVEEDANNPTRRLVRQILGAINEYEKSMIVLKLRGARIRQKAKTGRCEGAKPYGDLPGEKEVIARMRELRASGVGFDRIAAQLNAEGHKPRRGKQWWGLAVNKILSRAK